MIMMIELHCETFCNIAIKIIATIQHHKGISVTQHPGKGVHRFFTEPYARHTAAGASIAEGIHINQHIRSLGGLIAAGAFTEAVLRKGDSVQLIGFGTFGVKERAAREGRNPRTGEVVKIKASKVPTFKAGKGLKDKVAK